MLRHDLLTRTVNVPVSSGFLTENRPEFRRARRLSQRKPEPDHPIRRPRASMRAVENARQLASDVEATREVWTERLREWIAVDVASALFGFAERSGRRHIGNA